MICLEEVLSGTLTLLTLLPFYGKNSRIYMALTVCIALFILIVVSGAWLIFIAALPVDITSICLDDVYVT